MAVEITYTVPHGKVVTRGQYIGLDDKTFIAVSAGSSGDEIILLELEKNLTPKEIEINRLTARVDELKSQLFSVLYGGLPNEVTENILETCKNVKYQDNVCTSDPMYVIERLRKSWGFDSEYADDYAWVKGSEEADEEEVEKLDHLDAEGAHLDGWYKVYYKTYWAFESACFTRVACDRYIERHKHNLGITRVYVYSGYRNQEWQDMRELLLSLYEKSPQATAIGGNS